MRDGSPLDVPIMLFGWDKERDMHVSRGEKSKEDKERRKADELIAVVKEIFLHTAKLSYKNLSEMLIQEMEIKDSTAKRYIAYMREQASCRRTLRVTIKKENDAVRRRTL